MKKFLGLFLAVLIVVSCAFTMTACSPQAKVLTKSDYVEAFNCVDSTYNQFLASSLPSNLSATVDDSDLIDVSNDYQKSAMCGGLLWFVRFLKNVCQNDNFTLSNNYLDCDIVDSYSEQYILRFKMAYDQKTNLITSDVYCVSTNYGIYYLVFEIDYNFDTECLNKFIIHGYMGPETIQISGVNYFAFKNNTLKVFSTQSQNFQAFATQEIQALETISATPWATNRIDYSNEYNSAAPQ